ncbi:MAG: 2'-5' RNA ligase family protein [Xanthomonadaceae bacterium]|nr:2'-5' RNA ligase family protein [Xanthomonadaceae bacterium]
MSSVPPGARARPAATHRLFFALVPDPATRERLAHAGETFAASRPDARLRRVHPARYHATVHFLGSDTALRPDRVAAAVAAADTVHSASFTWTLDRVASFHGRQPPCVLCSAAVPAALQELWHALGHALRLTGPGGPPERGFIPHVTLAYSQGPVPEPAAIAPIVWPVTDFALLHSVAGQGGYRSLGRWALAQE